MRTFKRKDPDLTLSWLVLTIVLCATIYCLVFASYLATS